MAPKKSAMDAIYEESDICDSIPDDSKLQGISDMMKEYFKLEKRKVEVEVEMKSLAETLRRMVREYIPEAMSILGVDTIVTADGLKVSVEEKVYARLNKEDQLRGFAWLKKHGLDGIIKNQVIVNIDKKDPDQAKLVEKLLTTMDKHGMSYEIEEKVHAATLQAAIRDEIREEQRLIAQGKKIPASKKVPENLFNVFVGREAKIDLRAAKKAGLI